MGVMGRVGTCIVLIGIAFMTPFLLKIKSISARTITIQEFKAPREILLALVGLIIFIIGCLLIGESNRAKWSPWV